MLEMCTWKKFVGSEVDQRKGGLQKKEQKEKCWARKKMYESKAQGKKKKGDKVKRKIYERWGFVWFSLFGKVWRKVRVWYLWRGMS